MRFWRTLGRSERRNANVHHNGFGSNGKGAPRLDRRSTVLALVPHFQCEEWLAACLESLLKQTRPPDGIVVIDDGSGNPPVDIVKRYPQVTLLASPENVGPYRLVQQVIDDTRYDAYLFQDADDWSMPERLEVLLAEAERTGAELIGAQEIRVVCDVPNVRPMYFPLDVNETLRKNPAKHCLLHPTSVVSRDLVHRIGGFATGLRFSGDVEFVRRATYVARVVNVPNLCYVRRKRAGALTTAPGTGLQSPARLALQDELRKRAEENFALFTEGKAPDLSPIAVTDPIPLTRITGPKLRRTRARRFIFRARERRTVIVGGNQ